MSRRLRGKAVVSPHWGFGIAHGKRHKQDPKEERMKFRALTCITAITVFAALAIPVRLAAQEQPAPQEQKKQHPRYKLIDLGTFGGPNSTLADGNPPLDRIINNRGTIAGTADTAIVDPYSPKCLLLCFVSPGFQWQNG